MNSDSLFVTFLLIVLIAFGFFMKFLVNYRKKSLEANLRLTSSDVWNSVKSHAIAQGLERENVIYAIYQDHSQQGTSINIRNNLDQEIATTIIPLIGRRRTMIIGNDKYIIAHLLTWNKEITLQREGSEEILAKWVQTSWFGKHEIRIPNYGTLVSGRVSLDFKARYSYRFQDKIVGLKECTINGQQIGKVAILPDSIPQIVRAFILSV